MRFNANHICFAAACTVLTTIRSSETEDARLIATINPGALEIMPASLATEFSPIQANITLTGAAQSDAITFNISDIEINDLNGDGLGWKLSAVPYVLSHTSNGSTLPIGTVKGFQNPSDVTNSLVESPDELIYLSGTGIANYQVDYEISYTIPVTASAGGYTGVIVFNIVAQ